MIAGGPGQPPYERLPCVFQHETCQRGGSRIGENRAVPELATGPIYTLTKTRFLDNRVNLLLLGKLTAGQLAVTPYPRGRGIADQFAHLHNVCFMWLDHSAPAAMQNRKELEKGVTAKLALAEAL
jgi:hypothetical protein